MVNTLPTEPSWAGKRVNYGKDRCAYIPKSQQAAAQQAQAAAAQSLVAQQAAMSPQQATFAPFAQYPGAPFTPVDMMNPVNMASPMGGVQAMNRTVYLGNIHPETTPEDLCNAIRGGVLQSIRYMQDKHIAVSVTFGMMAPRCAGCSPLFRFGPLTRCCFLFVLVNLVRHVR